MLAELRVRDLVVIQDVTLPLKPGLNVLTGETGAGKSMLVDALALMLGERASAEVIRPGADRAVVEVAFDVRDVPNVREAADEVGIDIEDDRLVVRREINAEGRNRAWANGSPTTVGALGTLGGLLVDLHGQHETQSLLKPRAQRDMLDAFGDLMALRDRVRAAYRAAEELSEREAELVRRRDDVMRRADYLRHVVKEINEARPTVGEDEVLEAEHRRLANVEELTALTERLLGLLEGGAAQAPEAAGVQEALGAARRALDQLERVEPLATQWRELVETAATNLDELALGLRAYLADIDADPARLAEVERRRDVLYRLTQKYGPTLADVLRTAEESARELEVLDTAGLDLDRLAGERAAAQAEYDRLAAELSTKRRRAAKRLASAVQRLLPDLGMPDGRFDVDVGAEDTGGPAGRDLVTFVVQLNPGLEARPLAQVASGGELSRLMLALKVVLAAHDAVPTLVFDEVDQGIGGAVAVRVGEALAEVARARQVLVVTHLPQIAARADHHIAIAKRARGGVATADVQVLDGEARITELARMLGDEKDAVARQHASEMLKRTPRPAHRRSGAPTNRLSV